MSPAGLILIPLKLKEKSTVFCKEEIPNPMDITIVRNQVRVSQTDGGAAGGTEEHPDRDQRVPRPRDSRALRAGCFQGL